VRRAVMGVAVALVALGPGANEPARAADPMTCPDVTALQQQTTALGLERWCERAGSPAVRHGPYVVLHPNGQLYVRGEYREGAPAGAWKSWYPGGAQSGEAQFHDGRPTGMLLGWYENGRGSFVGGFRDGVVTGRIEVFDADGRLRMASDYDGKGVELGRQAWDESGQAIDPKSADASRLGQTVMQTSPLLYWALMASNVVR
jgi:hypothetical protein